MTDDEFEELVYLLAHADDPSVRRIAAPDGGLDTVRLRPDDQLEADWGIQAKHHTGRNIGWADCKRSLDRAATIWKPDRVTFAFPRRFTRARCEQFNKHLGSYRDGITTDWWDASKLTAMMVGSDAGRAVARRFFDTENPADLLDRAMRAGGPLRTGNDVVERELTIGEFLHSSDSHYALRATRSRADEPEQPPADGTVVRMEHIRDGQRLSIDAIPRDPASIGALGGATVTFETPDARDRAMQLVQAMEEGGGRAELGEVELRMQTPPLLFDQLADGFRGRLTVEARSLDPDPWAATAHVETDRGAGHLDFDLAPADPGPDWDVRLVGSRHGLGLNLCYRWSHSDKRGTVRLHWVLTRAMGSPAERASVLRFADALHGAGTFRLLDREGRRPAYEAALSAVPPLDALDDLARGFEAFAAIEVWAGRPVLGPVSDSLTYEELDALLLLEHFLATGEMRTELTSMTMRLDAAQLKRMQADGSGIVWRDTLVAKLFGDDRAVARRETQVPTLRVHDATCDSTTGFWDVELVPANPAEATVTSTLRPLTPDDPGYAY